MTGYGRGSALHGIYEISVEVRSLNRRNLDAIVTLPREWQALEGRILSALKERVERGRVVIHVQAQLASERDEEAFDSASIAILVEEFRTLSESLKAPFTITPDLLLQLALYAKKNQNLPDPETVEGILLDARPGQVHGAARGASSGNGPTLPVTAMPAVRGTPSPRTKMQRKYVQAIRRCDVVFALGPLLVLIFNSLKSFNDVGTNPIGLPRNFIFDNYANAWVQGEFATTLTNSVIYVVFTVAGVLILVALRMLFSK